MNLDDSPSEAAFRAELRAWLEENTPREPFPAEIGAWHEANRGWHRRLHAAGYTALSWPVEAGGRGLGPIEEAIFAQEVERLGVTGGLNYGFIARAMLLFATPEQQRRHLPGLLSGDTLWCQGFSEPGAGSDLAALRTRATPDPTVGEAGGFRVSGQKTWTSNAQWADFCLCLVRTGSLESRHRGISVLVIDMRAPGVEVRPIRTIRGDAEFCEVFFDETPVPAQDLIGEVGQGWKYAMVTLTYERGPADIGFVSKYQHMLERLRREADRRAIPVGDPIRRDISRSAVAIEVLRVHVARSLSMRLHGPPGPEGSVDKLLMARVEQDLLHTAMRFVGPRALVDDAEAWFADYLYSRAATIYGGSQQIQHGVLAERVLGMPR
jgi:alkylation response protein AidB-like acyl-CoA dehydrogenase